MDEADIASDITANFTEAALRMARERREAAKAVSSDGTCRDCGEPIEEERLAVNPCTDLCCDCAAEREAARIRKLKTGC
jgi:RNA polymerase-binding transcription factor DksA